MSKPLSVVFAFSLLLFFSNLSQAYWPTVLTQNLIVAGDTTLYESYPAAVPYPEGAVLVVYKVGSLNYYQIIDRYGEFQYPGGEPLFPNFTSGALHATLLELDSGGIYAVCEKNYTPEGIFAQRLDDQGNRLWGDDGVQIFPQPEGDYDICLDDNGGFFLMVKVDEPALDYTDLWGQHVDSSGNLLWGVDGIPISTEPNSSERHPRVAPDGNGGCFVVWIDFRDPYWQGAIFAQHLDGEGNQLWGDDIYICDQPYFHELISDGEGGFILMANPNGNNTCTHWRYNGNGSCLWMEEGLSYYGGVANKMFLGEPGFFYLGFLYDWGAWGQRVDINATPYWSTPPFVYGAQMSYHPGWTTQGHDNYYYKYPNFYGIYQWNVNDLDRQYRLYVNAIDSLGNPLFSDQGAHIWTHIGNMNYLEVVPIDDGGIVGVFTYGILGEVDTHAKRVNADGTLGGPLHLLVDLEPQNPPVQIPPSGGSFQFNIAIEDTYVVESVFDAWIEVTLPNGEDIEILHRDDIFINRNSIINRPDMIQNVPGNAPAGTYVYHFYIGNHDYNIPWSEDSLTFEKLGSEGNNLSSRDDWNLIGFFEESRDESQLKTGEVNPDNYELLSVYPSPFNNSTTLEFTLAEASPVRLTVYDISGRLVEILVDGYKQPGSYETVWKADNHASGIYFVKLILKGKALTKKFLLIK